VIATRRAGATLACAVAAQATAMLMRVPGGPGQDRGGELASEGAQDCGPALAGAEADGAEPPGRVGLR
jgi:hypothetical protein